MTKAVLVVLFFAAATGLGTIGGASAVPSLTRLVKDPHWSVRKATVSALGQLKEASAVVPLIPMLKDPDHDVRETTCHTFAKLRDRLQDMILSNIDEDRNFVGERNRAGRYPTFASLDMQVLKSLSAPGRFKERYRFRVGVKVFNVTNHFNPRDYQGNLASQSFGDFNNSVGRTFRGKWVFEF